MELVFGGDVIPHGEVKRVAEEHARTAPSEQEGEPARSVNNEGWDHVFGPIADVLRTADVGVVNLETPVTDNKKAVTRQLLFNAPSAMVRALATAGVKLVSTGNNHARDQHLNGILETLQHLDAVGHSPHGDGDFERGGVGAGGDGGEGGAAGLPVLHAVAEWLQQPEGSGGGARGLRAVPGAREQPGRERGARGGAGADGGGAV